MVATDLKKLSFKELFEKGLKSAKDRESIEQFVFEKSVQLRGTDKDLPKFPSTSSAANGSANGGGDASAQPPESKPTRAKRAKRGKAAAATADAGDESENVSTTGESGGRSFWGPKLKILDVSYSNTQESSLSLDTIIGLINNSADTLKDLTFRVWFKENETKTEGQYFLEKLNTSLTQLPACSSFSLRGSGLNLSGIPLFKHFPALDFLSLSDVFGVDAHSDLDPSKIKLLDLSFSLDAKNPKQTVFSKPVIFPALEDLIVNPSKTFDMDFEMGGGPLQFGIFDLDWKDFSRSNPFPNLVSVQVGIGEYTLSGWVTRFTKNVMDCCPAIRKYALVNSAGTNTLAGYLCMGAEAEFYSRGKKAKKWPLTHMALIGFDIFATGFFLGLTPDLESLKLVYSEGEGEKFPAKLVGNLKNLKELNISADYCSLPAKDLKPLLAKMPALEKLIYCADKLGSKKKGFNLFDAAPGLKKSLKTIYLLKAVQKNCPAMIDQCKALNVEVKNFAGDGEDEPEAARGGDEDEEEDEE